MIASEENSAGITDPMPQDNSLQEKSSAPTVRDLRAAATDLLINLAEVPDASRTDPNGVRR